MQPRFARVKDHPHLVKDLETQAVLNIDPNALRRHKALAANMTKEQQRDEDIAQIRQELNELKGLKGLLEELLKKLG